MLEDQIALETLKAEDKFHRSNDRTIRDFGYGDTAAALDIATDYVVPLAARIEEKLGEDLHPNSTSLPTVTLLRLVDAEVLALIALQATLHSVAVGWNMLSTADFCGRNVQKELFAQELRTYDPKLFERIDAKVRRDHGSLKYRAQAARSIAKRAGFERDKWSAENSARVGSWLLDILLTTLPEVFVMYLPDGEEALYHITITDGAHEQAMEACRLSIQRNPVFLPSSEPPQPWVDHRPNASGAEVVRSKHRATREAVAEAIASGQMAPCLDALNAIQATGWRINTRVMDVMQECFRRGIEVPKFPRQLEYPAPPKDKAWDLMTDQERTVWKIKSSEIKQANRIRVGNNLSFTEDMATAELFRDRVFYTACNLDWRGRVYPLPHFNFQREDRVRALFLFEHGEQLGDRGLYWLKVHVANCGDFNKISKRSFEERVQWVDQNIERIAAVADNPMSKYRLWWINADKPFLFLAACMELVDALSQGSSFASALPLSWDGSCSGLQHLSAMTRGDEGALVNLTDAPEPQDVYQTVADKVQEVVTIEAAEGHPIAKLALAHGISRKVVKRNVMTYSYSSKKSGMAGQQDEDLMEPLRLRVTMGQLEDHPFEEFGKRRGKTPSAAARYLAGHTYDAIEQIVHKPAEAMAFLQKLARLTAHAGKPLEWTTPVGLPWINIYHPRVIKRIRLWLHDRGVMLRMLVADGYKKEIAKDKAANGVAPNFVHALDAAHLMLTVNAGARDGMRSFAMVHDSFGCHAARSERFHELIRDEFVRMYTDHDVLDEVYQRAKCALNEHNWRRLPDVVNKGSLDINGVRDAKYAFA